MQPIGVQRGCRGWSGPVGSPGPTARRSGRAVVVALGVLVATGLAALGCSSPPAADDCANLPLPQAAPRPGDGAHERGLHVGFEDLERSPEELADLDARMRRAGIDTVAVSAGRADWTAFPWPARAEAWSTPVQRDGRDLFADAVRALGAGRHVSAVVDVLADRYVAANPSLAARDARGRPVGSHVSTVELVEGESGRRLLEMVDHLARTYPVDSIDITELFYRDEGYGDDDLASYRARTGRGDWPRAADGSVDTTDPSIGRWRSEMVARFVARAADLAHAQRKELLVDVRPSWSDLRREGEENGQCYRMLLSHADRLVVWNYFALDGVPVSETDRLAAYLQDLAPGRFVMGAGLWGRGGTVPPAQFADALDRTARAGVPAQWVIPQSLMQDAHWRVLDQLWGPAA